MGVFLMLKFFVTRYSPSSHSGKGGDGSFSWRRLCGFSPYYTCLCWGLGYAGEICSPTVCM